MAGAAQDKPRKARAYLEGFTPTCMDLLAGGLFRKSSISLCEKGRVRCGEGCKEGRELGA